MTIQSSGPISMQDLQDEYGGGHPISMTEYYKNGSYVPSVVNVPQSGSFTDYYSAGAPQTYWSTGVFNVCIVDDVEIYSGMGSSAFTLSIGGTYYYYSKGSYRGEFPEGTYLYGVSLYKYRPTAVNTSVPTSGAISLASFYGGRNT